MIEMMKGLPDNVVGIVAKERVTRKDYLEVVIPAIEKALKQNATLRLYYELGSQYTGIDLGAEWEDFKIGMEHLSRWERAAVLTDVAWISQNERIGVFNAGGGTRTRTALSRQRILSPLRMPFRHPGQ